MVTPQRDEVVIHSAGFTFAAVQLSSRVKIDSLCDVLALDVLAV